MNRAVGVIATVGDDRGLTPQGRRRRAAVERWRGVLEAARQRVRRIEVRLLAASDERVPMLTAKRDRALAEMQRAEDEIAAIERLSVN